MGQGSHLQKAVGGTPLQVPAGRGVSCSLHAKHSSPSQHVHQSGPGYITLRRMTRTFSQPPPSIQPEFTRIHGCSMMIHGPVTLFSQPRTYCFAFLSALISPSEPSPVTPSSRKFLSPSPGQTFSIALWLPSLHRIPDNCSFVCLARWAVVVFFECKYI